MTSSAAVRAAAEAELRRRRKIREEECVDFNTWLKVTSPKLEWDVPHLLKIQEALAAIERRDIDRLILNTPPRHGKTEQVTVRYPAYRLEKNPQIRNITGAYNQLLVDKFSRKTRRIARQRGIRLNPERKAVHDWETTQGGGLRAVGVGGGITGSGGDLILIDDPIKNREEAESETYREKLWAWFLDDLWTRREPGCAVVLTMTQWHHDDIVGRILNGPDAKEWHVLKFPALAEENDPLGRPIGAALWPERFNEDWLHKQEAILGDYSFAGLYQCRPVPRTGNPFPRDKIQFVEAHEVPRLVSVWRGWDKAGTKDGGKRTAGVKIGIGVDKLVYVLHERVGQWDSHKRAQEMLTQAKEDGKRVKLALEQEPGSGGKESAEASVRNMQGFIIDYRPATGDKMTRADPFSTQWIGGNVRLVRGDWNKAYLDEMEISPSGKYTDRMDASALAYNRAADSKEIPMGPPPTTGLDVASPYES